MKKNKNYILTPQLDANDDKALVIDINCKNYSSINEGDIIATIESTKATFEIPSDYSGFIYFLCDIDDEVKVGDKIALVSDDLKVLNQIIDDLNNESDVEKNDKSPKLTKKAEAAIKKYKIDINKINKKGIIKEKDILDLIKPNDDSYQEILTLKGNKQLGKDLMIASKSEIPHSQVEIEFNVTKLLQVISLLQKESANFVSLLGIITYATANALKTNKFFNSYRYNNDIFIYKDINIGIVISNDNDLSLPIVRNSDFLLPDQIVKELFRIRKELLKNKSKIKDYTDGTFTISALDHTAIKSFVPIIHPKQSAVLALPSITEKLSLINEEVKIEKVINLGISFDHSFINATMANNFLSDIIIAIEEFI